MSNNELRRKARTIHSMYMIPYKRIALNIGIKYGSFINWLNGYYDFSEQRQELLSAYIADIEEE